jgi:uncharacterized membrane protein
MTEQVQIAPGKVASDLDTGDLRAALAAGWRDFLAYPAFGLFFGGIYVAMGVALYYGLVTRGAVAWLLPLAAGFPLLGPFAGVGLYEISRRREAGLPVSWGSTLGAMRGRGDEQLIMMGGIVFVAFSIWIGLAHGIFAIFLFHAGPGMHSLDMLQTGAGLAMLAVGTGVGAFMALALYSITVISLPMLVDRDVDFITAIIVSLATVRSNGMIMLIWAALMAALLFLAMLPFFLGLLVALPVLGHATWHLYRRAVGDRQG